MPERRAHVRGRMRLILKLKGQDERGRSLNKSLRPRTLAPGDFCATFRSRSERRPYLTSSFLRRDRIDLLAGSAQSSRRILHGSATASSSSNGRGNGFPRTKLLEPVAAR